MAYQAHAVATGLSRPVFATAPGGDPNRLFIVEQGGRIRILDLTASPPALLAAPFLTVPGLATGQEQGLLGLAFHPKYATNRTFFVNYTDILGDTVIAQYSVPAGTPNQANPTPDHVVLWVDQPFANHNGGWLGFGPDNFLYVGLGDGGAGNDPNNNGQNLGVLLGKMLRIDIDGNDFPGVPNRHYAIPPSNPFVAVGGAAPEIWAYGLRNPWRCSFDRKTGELYIADVGQGDWEEVNVQPANNGGQNYGWRVREGYHDTGLSPSGGGYTDPVHEYGHGEGVAIIGGYVYRGARIPELVDRYLFADHSGPIWSLTYAGGVASPAIDIAATLFPTGARPTAIASFGEDDAGELYLLNRTPGTVYRIEPSVASPTMSAGAPRSVKRRAAAATVTWGRPQSSRAASDTESPAEAGMAAIEVPSAPGGPVQEARALLQVAAAIEHALLLQYLYALYSLDTKMPSYGALSETLKDIAIEEMGHLITVQNLLLAIGGEVYFSRESPRPEDDPFPFRLQPVASTSLAKYVTAESPLPANLASHPDILLRANRAYELAKIAAAGSGAPTPSINHVGALYSKLYWLFQSTDAWEGPWPEAHKPGPYPGTDHIPAAAINPSAHQASGDELGGGNAPGVHVAYVAPVNNRAEALAALYQIAAQGEGWVPGDNELSHFERFLTSFEDFAKFIDDGIEPTLPVPTDPTTGDDGPTVPRNCITHPSSRLWAELCDVRYQMLIGELWLGILLPANDALRATLFQRSIRKEMQVGVAKTAKKLALLPRTPATPALKAAGAPFRMPAYADLPGDVEGWKQYLRDRIARTAQLRTRLESSENTIPLTPFDLAQILNPLTNWDAELLGLLAP